MEPMSRSSHLHGGQESSLRSSRYSVLDMTTLNAVCWLDREANGQGSDAPEGKKPKHGAWDYGVVYEKRPPARTANLSEQVMRIVVPNSASPHIPGDNFRNGDPDLDKSCVFSELDSATRY